METLSITRAMNTSLGAFARKALVVAIVTIVAAVASSAVVAGCEKKGPAEKAGENIDKAAKDVGNSVENAGEKIKDAAD